jgi:hypothetical protein
MTAKLFASLFTVTAMASAASHADMLVSTDWLAGEWTSKGAPVEK